MLGGYSMDVMLVEDQPEFRELVATVLRRAGISVSAADLQRWEADVIEQRPEVVLLDLGLGASDAVESIPRLVASCPATMVAVLTGRPAEEERATRAAGAFVFYEKSLVMELPTLLPNDRVLFQRALAGKRVVAPSALLRRRRSAPRSGTFDSPPDRPPAGLSGP
jgi:CheY-like chemotaxis protein